MGVIVPLSQEEWRRITHHEGQVDGLGVLLQVSAEVLHAPGAGHVGPGRPHQAHQVTGPGVDPALGRVTVRTAYGLALGLVSQYRF